MGNYVTVKNELENYIEARVPLIIINTCERERAEKMLREVSRDKRIEIGYYTDARQVTQFGSKAVKDVENDPLPYVAEKFRRNRRVTFALGDTRKIGEENMYSKELLNILYLALENASTLIIITPDIVWSRIAQFGMLTVLDYPDDEERWLKFVVAAFREGVDHGAVENGLVNWLVEKEKWMVPQAEGMQKRYRDAIAVLQEYTKG